MRKLALRGARGSELPNHPRSSTKRSTSSAEQSERLRHPAANRHSMRYTSHAAKNGPSNKDLKDWFAECCDQRSNSSAHDRRTKSEELDTS
jgi:hypothetical protein